MTKDIYLEMDLRILLQDFWYISIEEKKKLVENELRNYILCKIDSVDSNLAKKLEGKDLSVIDLIHIFSTILPLDKRFDVLRHFTHYIIMLVSNLQNCSVIWWVEEDTKLIDAPVLKMEDETWTELKTHDETDYVKTFVLVYNMFINNFMTKNSDKRLMKKINIA